MIIDLAPVDELEVVIGLAAAIGANVDGVESALKQQLKAYGYSSETVRLSSLIPETDGSKRPGSLEYYQDRMDQGDRYRRENKSADALAALGISKITTSRPPSEDDGDLRRHAWIIRAIKHEDEAKLLRHVYGERFILIALQEPAQDRLSRLVHETDLEMDNIEIQDLIRRDEKDEADEFGQHVRDAFGLADYFIDAGGDLEVGSRRLVSLLFGEPFATPTRDELAMFVAFGNSRRSADAGRQVGAAIAHTTGEIIATGSNEVPRPGGGEYWVDHDDDARDFVKQSDFNKHQIREVLRETLDVLAQQGLLSDEFSSLKSDERVDQLTNEPPRSLKKSRLYSLIEFGRAVHAEMSALMQAARLGISVQGATLYTTTYPCHLCMRLIISSGIKRMVFVDPYPKSLAPTMYEDAITLDPTDDSRLLIEPYVGTGWGIFASIFTAHGRDELRAADGSIAKAQKAKARFKLAEPYQLPLRSRNLEPLVVKALQDAMSVANGTN